MGGIGERDTDAGLDAIARSLAVRHKRIEVAAIDSEMTKTQGVATIDEAIGDGSVAVDEGGLSPSFDGGLASDGSGSGFRLGSFDGGFDLSFEEGRGLGLHHRPDGSGIRRMQQAGRGDERHDERNREAAEGRHEDRRRLWKCDGTREGAHSRE